MAGLFDRIRSALSGGATRSAEPVSPAPPPPPPPPVDEIAMQSMARRDAFWAKIGIVETDVLGHLISPSFMGGPHWPTTRQAYRVIRREEGSTLIATDGMSDPFTGGGDVNGFECELFIETADLTPDVAGSVGVIDPLKHSWAFELLSHVAGMIAEAGGAKPQFDLYGALSMEVPGVSQSTAIKQVLPGRFVTDDDALGILIGGPAPDFPERIEDMPLSPVRLLPIVILTAAELEVVRNGGRAARDAMVSRLSATPTAHRSSLSRTSVV